MPANGDTLNPRQERAIEALLTSATQKKAAEKAGIGERTLKRWLAEPAFAAAYRQARREVVEHAVGILQQLAGRAVATLGGLMGAEHGEGVRCRAAAIVLEQSLRGVELGDLLVRVEALEAAAAAKANGRVRP